MKKFFAVLALLTLPAVSFAWTGSGILMMAGGTSGGGATYTPNAPTGVSATAGDTQNTVSWTGGATDGSHSAATSYDLLWGTSSGSEPNAVTGVTSPYVHTGLTNGTNYYYKMRGNNSAGSATSTEAGPYTPVAPSGTVYTFDGTNGSAPESAFTVTTAGSGTAILDGSSSVKVATTSDTDGALVYYANNVTLAATHKYRVRFKAQASTISPSTGVGLTTLAVKYDSGAEGLPGTFGYPLIPNVMNDGGLKIRIGYYDAGSVIQSWNLGSGSWSTSSSNTEYTLSDNTWYWLELVTSSTGFTYNLYDAGAATSVGSLLVTTTQVAWSGVLVPSGSPRVQLGGDYLTNTLHGTIYYDTFIVE